MTARSSSRLIVNAQKVQKSLFSGIISGTMTREAATARPASTMKNQPRGEPEAKLTIRHTTTGIMNSPETTEPTVALRRRKRFAWYSITCSFSS